MLNNIFDLEKKIKTKINYKRRSQLTRNINTNSKNGHPRQQKTMKRSFQSSLSASRKNVENREHGSNTYRERRREVQPSAQTLRSPLVDVNQSNRNVSGYWNLGGYNNDCIWKKLIAKRTQVVSKSRSRNSSQSSTKKPKRMNFKRVVTSPNPGPKPGNLNLSSRLLKDHNTSSGRHNISLGAKTTRNSKKAGSKRRSQKSSKKLNNTISNIKSQKLAPLPSQLHIKSQILERLNLSKYKNHHYKSTSSFNPLTKSKSIDCKIKQLKRSIEEIREDRKKGVYSKIRELVSKTQSADKRLCSLRSKSKDDASASSKSSRPARISSCYSSQPRTPAVEQIDLMPRDLDDLSRGKTTIAAHEGDEISAYLTDGGASEEILKTSNSTNSNRDFINLMKSEQKKKHSLKKLRTGSVIGGPGKENHVNVGHLLESKKFSSSFCNPLKYRDSEGEYVPMLSMQNSMINFDKKGAPASITETSEKWITQSNLKKSLDPLQSLQQDLPLSERISPCPQMMKTARQERHVLKESTVASSLSNFNIMKTSSSGENQTLISSSSTTEIQPNATKSTYYDQNQRGHIAMELSATQNKYDRYQLSDLEAIREQTQNSSLEDSNYEDSNTNQKSEHSIQLHSLEPSKESTGKEQNLKLHSAPQTNKTTSHLSSVENESLANERLVESNTFICINDDKNSYSMDSNNSLSSVALLVNEIKKHQSLHSTKVVEYAHRVCKENLDLKTQLLKARESCRNLLRQMTEVEERDQGRCKSDEADCKEKDEVIRSLEHRIREVQAKIINYKEQCYELKRQNEELKDLNEGLKAGLDDKGDEEMEEDLGEKEALKIEIVRFIRKKHGWKSIIFIIFQVVSFLFFDYFVRKSSKSRSIPTKRTSRS